MRGTPVQLLRAQTEAVAYKATLARPSARSSRYGIDGGRCGGCVRHRQELSTSPSCTCCTCCCFAPELDPALLVMSRHDALDLPSTPCDLVPSPLAWGRNIVPELRAEAARVGRWWPWFDSNGVTLLVQQYDRVKHLLRTAACYTVNTWYLYVPDTWYVWSPYNTKRVKYLFLRRPGHNFLLAYQEVYE